MPKKSVARLLLFLVGTGLWLGGQDLDAGELGTRVSAVFQVTKAHGQHKFPEQRRMMLETNC